MRSSYLVLKKVVHGGACGRDHIRGVVSILLLPCFKNFCLDVVMSSLKENLLSAKQLQKTC